MDLTALESLSQQAESRNAEQMAVRHSEAQHFYVLGYTCLRLARKVDYSNRVLLRKSLEFLVQSLARNRRAPDVLTTLAFLLLICDAPMRALPFLQEALALDPEHASAHLLRTWVQSGGMPTHPDLPPDLTPIRRLQETPAAQDLLPLRSPRVPDQQLQALGGELQAQIKKAFEATKRAKQPLDAAGQEELRVCREELLQASESIAAALVPLGASGQALQRQWALLDKLLHQLPGVSQV